MESILHCSGYATVEVEIVRATGCDLYDATGKRYVDFEAGVWCTGLGHNHPRITQALCAQLDQVAHLNYRYANEQITHAARALLATLDWPHGKALFLSSGSEAVEVGVKITRHLSTRPLLLTLTETYLAAYGSAAHRDPGEWVTFDWGACTRCPEETCAAQCPQLQALPWERIGGMAFEPGNSSGLVKFPPRKLVQTLAREVQQRGGLLVVDEVTTGLGRTGAWYGYQHYNLQPDIVALGKGLGNGYPVSAVALRPGLVEPLLSSGFHHAQSHQNDPLACRVAAEVLAVLQEEEMVARSREVGADFRRALEHLADQHDAIAEVRGRGLMLVAEFVGAGDPVTPLYHRLLERGFIVGCKPAAKILRFYPPLIIAREDIRRLIAALEQELTQ